MKISDTTLLFTLTTGPEGSFFYTLLQHRGSIERSGQNINDGDNGVAALSIGIVLVLLALSLYLLFRVKKGQVAERMLKVVASEREMLFNNAPCGYHSVDDHGTLLNMNDTLLHWLGYERQDIIGKMKFTDLIDADAHKAREKIDAMHKVNGGKIDLNLVRKNGEKFPVVLATVKIEGSLDASKRLFSTIDNTKCHEALERIKHLDQELEAFSYSISHDLRAPLRSIDGYSKILQEDYATRLDDEGRRVLNVVMNNARRMGKLIDDLLDFGRLGRKTMQRTLLNMNSLVQGIVQELLGQEPTRPIDVVVTPLLPAPADADMIRQVWFNLLENAVKFTGKSEHPHIEIRSYRVGESEVTYEVKDNGVGFDMQYAGKLFGMFQRLHKMQDFSGTGVGLAIVKRIISRHGGRTWADATLNQGATFYFTLPVDDDNS
jgi:PAS domain S-box-containing protein